MREGVQIDQIDQLKPGDVLVLDVPEEFKRLLDDYCLTNGKSYPLYQAMDGNLWIDCDCFGGGPGFGLYGLEAAGLLRFFRLKTPSEPPPPLFVNIDALRPTMVRPGAFVPLSGLPSDTDWDGTDGLGDEAPAGVRYAEVGDVSFAISPSGTLFFRGPGEGWLQAQMLDRSDPDFPRGAQATSAETPTVSERAKCLETPFALERAICPEQPIGFERDILNETPTLLDRDMQFEPTITGDRGIAREKPSLLDRAMLIETPVKEERAITPNASTEHERAVTTEPPRSHEPIDFLALNKEFSSK